MPLDKLSIFHQHLGDGVYITFDGHYYVLRANSHLDRHPIYLEPQVVKAFLDYAKTHTPEVFS